jgi:rod shape-determining protein MreC
VLRGGRVFSFAMTMVIVALLIFFSAQGALGPFQSVISLPLDFLQRVFGGTTHSASTFVEDVAQYQRLEQRNKDLEEAAAISQAELAQLKEKALDYDRLAALLEYDQFGPEDHQYVTCNVIGVDSTGFVTAIRIDCGRRDGVERLDPVVTELGLVGRITELSATGAEVLLVTDPNSRVNARLQTTRADGVVIGQLGGDLVMSFIPIDAQVNEGDLVMTNGLGQTLPANLVVGKVLSVALAENELYQEARVRSLVDFDKLEIVQVIINFEPVDLSVFEKQATTP